MRPAYRSFAARDRDPDGLAALQRLHPPVVGSVGLPVTPWQRLARSPIPSGISTSIEASPRIQRCWRPSAEMPADSNPRWVSVLVKVASIVGSARTSMTVSASFGGRTGTARARRSAGGRAGRRSVSSPQRGARAGPSSPGNHGITEPGRPRPPGSVRTDSGGVCAKGVAAFVGIGYSCQPSLGPATAVSSASAATGRHTSRGIVPVPARHQLQPNCTIRPRPRPRLRRTPARSAGRGNPPGREVSRAPSLRGSREMRRSSPRSRWSGPLACPSRRTR